MSAPATVDAVRARLLELLTRSFGVADERPFQAGVLDSLKSIEFGLVIESELGVKLGELETDDFNTITGLATKIVAVRQRA